MNRQDRRAEGKRLRKAGRLDTEAFQSAAGEFIDVANRLNERIVAADLAIAFQYAAARYAAHLGKNVLAVEKHEDFVEDMVKQYAEMLRQNLADPEL